MVMASVLPLMPGAAGADCTMVIISPPAMVCTWQALPPLGWVHILIRRHFWAGLPGSLTVMILPAGSAREAGGVGADWPHARPDAARPTTTLPSLVARTIGLVSFVRTCRPRGGNNCLVRAVSSFVIGYAGGVH